MINLNMSIAKIRWEFLCVIFIFSVSCLQAQTLTLVGNAILELDNSKPVVTFGVLLKVEPSGSMVLHFVGTNPSLVKLNNNPNEAFCKAFTYQYIPGSSKLMITVNLSQLQDQGTYEVNIAYYFGAASDNSVAEKKLNFLTLNVIRPAAIIENLGTVNIISDDNGHYRGTPIALRETGRKASLSDLTFDAPNIPEIKNEVIFSLPESSKYLGPGQAKQFGYIINPNALSQLPLGKTTFNVYVNSRLLGAPLVLPFEVVKNAWKGYIVLTVFVGMLFGLIVRHILKSKKDNEAARVMGLKLLSAMEQFVAKVNDPILKQTIEGYRNEGIAAINNINSLFNADPAQSVNIIQSIQSKFDQSRQNFQTTMQTDMLETLKVRDALYNPNLRPSIAVFLAEPKSSLKTAKDELDQNNHTGAETALSALKTYFELAVTNYQNYINSIFTFLGDQANLPKDTISTASWIAQQNTMFQKQFSSVNATDDMNTKLIKLNEIQKKLEEFPDDFSRHIQQDFEIKIPGGTSNSGLITALGRWSDMINNMVLNGDGKIDANYYEDASKLLFLNNFWVGLQSADHRNIASTLPGALESATEPLVDSNVIKSLIKTIDFPMFAFRQPDDYSNLNISLSNAKGNYIWYSVLQTLLLTLLIGLGAYKSYADTFIGSFDQVITIFLFAFTLDIAVDSVGQFKNKITL